MRTYEQTTDDGQTLIVSATAREDHDVPSGVSLTIRDGAGAEATAHFVPEAAAECFRVAKALAESVVEVRA